MHMFTWFTLLIILTKFCQKKQGHAKQIAQNMLKNKLKITTMDFGPV